MKIITMALMVALMCAPGREASIRDPRDPRPPIAAATDYTCVTDCLSRGYLYGYCIKLCSF